jgi:hypothetical protein
MSYLKTPTELTKPWASVMPFNDDLTIFEPKTLTGAVNFTIATTPPIPGSMVIYRLTGDGATIPTIDPTIVQIATSLAFNKAAGVVNTLQVWFDGAGYWYQWIRGAVPFGTGLASLGLTFPIVNANFTNPSPNVYSSSQAGAFSGSGGSAQAIPAAKDGQVTFLLGSTTLVGLHNANSAPAVAGAAPPWRYYLWNAGGTIYTGESGAATASAVTGVTAPRYVQLRRVGSIVTAWHKVLLTDPWLPVVTFAVSSGTALYVMLGTTGGQTAQVISFEVQP